jgi:nitrogen fixation/metabolism regulation signal transduction histidine kinase
MFTNSKPNLGAGKLAQAYAGREYRNELLIKIPVLSMKPKEFTLDRKDKFNFIKVTEQIFLFLQNESMKLGIANKMVDIVNLCEIVKNAYDAYANNGLKLNECLCLKVIVKKEDNVIKIKFKDNGPGFNGYAKGETISLAKINYQTKTNDFFGGKRIGIDMFSKNARALNGHVTLKNRKETGASVSVAFRPRLSRL